MNARARVLNFFHREKQDRVPIDYLSNPTIEKQLMKRLKVSDRMALLRTLQVDFMGIDPVYTGARLHPEKPGFSVSPDLGIVTRWITNAYGGYQDYCQFPLEFADEEEVAAYPMPTADDYDYDGALEKCKALEGEFSLYVANPGYACFINCNGFLRGMEQTLVDMITLEPAGLLLAKRRFELELARLERLLDKCGKYVDFMWLGEDLGTQHTPLISMDCYRQVIKPWHQKFFDLAKSFNLKIMMHTCGSSSWAYEEMIGMGLDAVDTLQPEAADMDPRTLKQRFGGRLCFHGCISTAGPVAYGTVDEVEENVRETLEIMKPGYEYAFSPTHDIQDNSPVENVVRMYESALKYGKY